MHDSRRWRLLCYDIRDPERYRRAHKLILGYGGRVQYSIFRCRLDDKQTARLRAELAKILSPEDALLILDLCSTCAARVVSTDKEEAWDRPPPSFAVVRLPKAARAPSPAQSLAPAETEAGL